MRDEKRNNKGRYNPRYNKDTYSEQNRGLGLPSPALLESYEEISPGLADKLADLIKQEQKHRHEWENKYLKAMARSGRMGQLFGLLIAIATLYTTIILAIKQDTPYTAIAVCISGFGFLICVVIASIKTKTYMRKPYYNKNYKR